MYKTIVTVNEVSEKANLPRAWIGREAHAGCIPCIRVSRRLMFAVETVRLELVGWCAGVKEVATHAKRK